MTLRIPSPAAACALLLLASCGITPVECDKECQDNWLDGRAIDDSLAAGLDSAHRFLVSARKDSIPDSVKAVIPVIVAAHGYTASTFEWMELRRFAGDVHPYVAGRSDSLANPEVLISLVLLGGHGRDIGDFQKSTWEEWGAPIRAEYDSLVKRGFKNISLLGASTGCPLILDHLAHKRFQAQPPNQVLMIDPIISPSDKLLSLIRIAGPIVGNSPSDGTPEEKRHWYTNRPAETLNQLYELTNLTKNRLEDGITLPTGTGAKVWKAKKDALADPVSALLLYKGLRLSESGRIDVEMVDTRKHVFTRLQGREGPTPADYALQEKTFREILDRVRAP